MRVGVRAEEALQITNRLADGEDASKLAQEFNISEEMVLTFDKAAIAALGKKPEASE